MNENLFARLRKNFPTDISTPFILTRSGLVFTYADMLARSAQYANVLTDIGISPGDRVAVQVEKSLDALMLYLAVIRAGATYLPLNAAYTPPEVIYFLSDAEPKLVVCRTMHEADIGAISGSARVEALGDCGEGGSLVEKADAASTSFEDVARGADDLAAILYTSGTTGSAKGAMLTHRNLSSNAEALVEAWVFTPKDRLLHALPIYHTHGLFTAINTILNAGASMLYLPRFDAQEVVSLLPQVTVMMGVPTFYSRLLQCDELTPESVAHMRLFISGSAPLSSEVHREFKRRTGHDILERYGMTETGMNTSNPYDKCRRAGTVGFALPGVELRIADPETGKELAQGEIGSIEVRGPNVFKGY